MFQPPTDNLYKFLAIFGLLVAGFSIYIPLQRYVEFNRLSNRASAVYGDMLGQIIALDDEAKAHAECTVIEAQKREAGKPYKFDSCDPTGAPKAKANLARNEVRRLKAKAQPLDTERTSTWQEYVPFLYLGIIGGTLGIAMCIGGFYLWYIRLQKHLDAAVRAEAVIPRLKVLSRGERK